jgi:hypothetical protein
MNSYGAALWWTAMIMTTMGSEYWPQSGAGRVLCFFLALYAFGVFGYVTATLATFFVGRDAEDDGAELASAKSIAELRAEIAALRADINRHLEGASVGAPANATPPDSYSASRSALPISIGSDSGKEHASVEP